MKILNHPILLHPLIKACIVCYDFLFVSLEVVLCVLQCVLLLGLWLGGSLPGFKLVEQLLLFFGKGLVIEDLIEIILIVEVIA